MKNKDEINVRKLCSEIGKNRLYVQGAGGNISWKEDKFLYVKASGMRLKDALSKDIFVKINLKKIRKQLIDNDFSINLDEFKNINSHKKPSIETAFHAIIPKKFVLHLHSIDALSQLVKSNAKKIIFSKIPEKYNIKFINYYKPGSDLAREIFKSIDDNNQVFFLKNHGIIITSDKIDEIKSGLLKISNYLKIKPKSFSKYKKILSGKKIKISDDIYIKPSDRKEINLLSISDYLYSSLKKSWALYPDHLVFLGTKPLLFDSISDLKKMLRSAKRIDSFKNTPLFVKNKGTFSFNGLSKVKKEQLICYYDVLSRQYSGSQLRVLSKKSINELVNWDQEKYRIKLTQGLI